MIVSRAARKVVEPASDFRAEKRGITLPFNPDGRDKCVPAEHEKPASVCKKIEHARKGQIIPERHVPAHLDEREQFPKSLQPVLRSRDGTSLRCFLVIASDVLADRPAISGKVGPPPKIDSIDVKDLSIHMKTRQAFQIEAFFVIPARSILV